MSQCIMKWFSENEKRERERETKVLGNVFLIQF